MNGWLLFGCWLIVWAGIKVIENQTEGKLDCYRCYGWFVAIVFIIFWALLLEMGVFWIIAVPITALITLHFCHFVFDYFIVEYSQVWACAFYLCIWIYVMFALLYVIGLIAVFLAAIGGGGAAHDYHNRYY